MVWKLPNFLKTEDLIGRRTISWVRSDKLGAIGHNLIVAKQYEQTSKPMRVSTEQPVLSTIIGAMLKIIWKLCSFLLQKTKRCSK